MKFTFPPEARPLDGYTIKRAIHRGGFGEVYYALSDAGKEVALKLLNNNLDVELRGVRQCLNLKHPNLVTIFDIRQDKDDDHWVVMEFVSGRGLYETLQDHPNGMPVEEVLAWLSGMTSGLGFLHDRGIVHRDLKPANVFRDGAGVKIGDVGLSKYISESRRSAQTQSVGTVYYMAPEVARGRYGREVDVYAMGVMLYEMLTGNVPFDGQTTAEILMKHLTAEPDLSVLPENLQPVVGVALEKDPDQRLSDITELERQFRAAVAGVDVKAPVPLTIAKPVMPVKPAPQIAERAAKVETPRPDRDADTVIDLETRAPVRDTRTTGLSAVVAFWNSLPAPLQWVIGGATALLILESGLLRPVAVGGMIGGIAYLGYQLLNATIGNTERSAREKVRARRGERSAATDHDLGAALAAAEAAASKARRAHPRPQPPPPQSHRVTVFTPMTPRQLSRRQRVADMSTSVCVSLFASALVTVAVFMTTNLLKSVPQAIYFGSVTMIAAWGLIAPAKMWEGRVGDSFTRRLTLGSIGLGVGFVAAVLAQYLMIADDVLFRGSSTEGPLAVGRVTIADGSDFPTVACFMIFFAALFAIRRWWWQVDSFRKSRFRVSSALFTLLVGIVITGMLQGYAFPDGLGATWALAISAVVQLSSGWTPTEDRLAKFQPRGNKPMGQRSSAEPVDAAPQRHPAVNGVG